MGEGNVFLHLKEAFYNFKNNEKLRLLSLRDITSFGLSESAFQFRGVFIASLWPLWAIGIAQMLSNIGAAIGFGFSGKILKKFKPINIMMFGTIYGKTVNMIALIFPTILSPALMTTTSLLYGSGTVANNSLFQKEFSDKQRATMGSLNSFGKSIFYAICAVFFGIIADITSPRISLIWGQLIGLVTLWFMWKLYKLIKTESA